MAEKKPGTGIALLAPKPVKFEVSEMAVDSTFAFPAGFEDAEIAPSSLSPTAVWGAPGEAMSGTYLGMQEGVGPNDSRLYSFRLKTGELVGVWGSMVLDNRMDLVRPAPGDEVAIVYVAEGQKKPGQNPPRIFAVAKVPAKR